MSRIQCLACLLLLGGIAMRCSAGTDKPEEVILTYQQFVDQNDFEAAAAMSTPGEAARLRELQELIAGFPSDTTRLQSRFLSVDCTVEEDVALCLCEVEDQEAAYTMEYRLLRIDGEWRMDVPVE